MYSRYSTYIMCICGLTRRPLALHFLQTKTTTNNTKAIIDIPFLLERLIDKTLPRYNALLGKRYPVKDLLDSCGKNVDRAYLEANWRYSRLVGQKLFPPGLHNWPPPVGWMDRITRRAVEGPHVTASTIATSSSSSSSGPKALTEHGLHVPVSTMAPSGPSSGPSMMTLHSKWAADELP